MHTHSFTFVLASLLLLAVVLAGRREKVNRAFQNSRQKDPADILQGRQLEFKESRRRNGPMGTVARFQQTFNGIPLRGAQISAHVNNRGEIDGKVFGEIEPGFGVLNTDPSITIRTAEKAVMDHWGYTSQKNKLGFNTVDPTELMIIKKNGENVLVFCVSFNVDWKDGDRQSTSITAPVPAWIKGCVDAQSGDVVETYNQINQAAITAVMGNSGPIGRYEETINVEQDGSKCEFKDESLRVTSVNLSFKRRLRRRRSGLDFKCSEVANDGWDYFSRTEGYSPRSEAFHFAGNLVKMYREQIGEDPHDPNSAAPGFYLQQRVHYGRRYQNAFYDGQVYTYGDGATRRGDLYPLTTQDIVCHEIGHGITARRGADLVYAEESGGMNEAYSDMTGEACDYKFYDRTSMMVGEFVARSTLNGGEGLRDMCNPARFGAIDHLDQYNPANPQGVHTTSGIYNKAFCTLARSTGWNILKAWKLFTIANLDYWTTTSTMNCGACGVLSAADDYIDDSSPIVAAFAVVGVSCDNCV